MSRCAAGLLIALILFLPQSLPGQTTLPLLSLQAADSLHRPRLWMAATTGTAAYGATMTGLYYAWYADYPLGRFHTVDDLREWNQMDKMGHSLMAYNESRWTGLGARWTGLSHRRAAWLGFAGGQLIQTSFELFDGFSKEWGFSWSDIGFNLLGSGLFLGQELGWRDQRICLKMSAWPVQHPTGRLYPAHPAGNDTWTTLQQRSEDLYGAGPVSLFLKNYNTLVVWASVNPRAFSRRPDGWWPRWLNVAAGLGADNLYAGDGYEWKADKNCQDPDCITYRVDPSRYPRTRQLFLSLDVDLTRLPVKNRFLRTTLAVLNVFKIPAPTLEWRSGGRVRLHPVYF